MSNVNFNCSSMYAFVKFYSRRAASRAKGRISGKRLLAGQFLKVGFELVIYRSLVDTLYESDK